MEISFVSKTERAYLLIFSLLISMLSLSNIISVFANKVINPPPFEIYDMSRPSLFPAFRILSLFVPVLVYRGQRYFASAAFTLLVLFPAYCEFIRVYQLLGRDYDLLHTHSSLELLFLIANPLDYLNFFLCHILLVWLTTLVVRSYTKALDVVS